MEHLVYYDIAAAFVLLTALVAYHLRKNTVTIFKAGYTA